MGKCRFAGIALVVSAVAAVLTIPGVVGAAGNGPDLELEPSSGACDSAISVHATGLDVGQRIYLFAAPVVGDSAPALLTYDSPVASSWDFTLPAGARFLCDEFAQPAMRIELSTGMSAAGEPTGVLATAARPSLSRGAVSRRTRQSNSCSGRSLAFRGVAAAISASRSPCQLRLM